jgi:hypothetical protein
MNWKGCEMKESWRNDGYDWGSLGFDSRIYSKHASTRSQINMHWGSFCMNVCNFYVLLTVHLDICVSWNQIDALFIFSLFSHYTSTCFGLASFPSSGGNNVYMQQLVRVVHFSWLSAGLDGQSTDSQLKRTTRTNCHIYTLLPLDDEQLASPKHVEV